MRKQLTQFFETVLLSYSKHILFSALLCISPTKRKKKYYQILQFEDKGTNREAGAKETFIEEAMGEPEAVLNFFFFP